MKRKRPHIVRPNASPTATATPATSTRGVPPSPPTSRGAARGNGSAGQPVLIGVRPTERHMAAMRGEFPTPTPPEHGAFPSIARQPSGRSSMFEEVAYADPYRLFPRETGAAYAY